MLTAPASERQPARTRKPPPGSGPASSVPPSSAARSRMPDEAVAAAPFAGGRAAAVVAHVDLERVGGRSGASPRRGWRRAWRSVLVSASWTIR